MAPVVPALPAILGFIGTAATITASVLNKPEAQDFPMPKTNVDKADQAVLDAARRRGFFTLISGEGETLDQSKVGASMTLGGEAKQMTLVGE